MSRALILDFDRSVRALVDSTSIDLTEWQQRIRYACSARDLRSLEAVLDGPPATLPPVTFLGSGDFHHVSLPLIRRWESRGRFQVVVFDNHPDNMRYPWGIHCGSWVHHVCALPFVSAVTVIGITSSDVAWQHLWENHLAALYRGKLSYLCLRKIPALARIVALPGLHDLSGERHRLVEVVAERILGERVDPIYLSIDKDVLAREAVVTNWDQGILRVEEVVGILRRLRQRIFAADVTGEVSFIRYASLWKRALARLDGQSLAPSPGLAELQAEHHAVNERLLDAISGT
ncbi:MAG: hypothetical protein QOD06_1332 [Candidatus Binatota bacterium]|nr:hypothetical protein [Candidatus Binatota bacterium]